MTTVPVADLGVGVDVPVRRLALHGLALLVVLVAAMVVIGPSTSYSADEGATIAQVHMLEDGTWIRPHPAPEIDPDGRWFPLEASVITPDGGASYAKHPLYPLAMRPFDSVLGVPGMVVASILATVAAAFGVAVLATRVRASLAIPVLWFTGIGSPLFFDSFLVIAHTIAAAFCAWSAVSLVVALDRKQRWVVPVILLALLVAGAVLFRSEALFLGPAFAVGALVAGGDVPLVRRAVVAGSALGAAGVAYIFDGWLSHAVLGTSGLEVFVPRSRPGFVSGRLEGLVNTWLRPVSGSVDTGSALIFASAVCVAVLGVIASRRTPDESRVRLFAGAAAVLAVIGAMLASTTVIPGLLVAFPIVLWLLPWSRELVEVRQHRVLLASAAVVAATVLATQYPEGGVAEWGGRYFAIALPLVIPSIADSIARAAARVGRHTAQVLLGSLVVAGLALSTVAVVSLRASHGRTEVVVEGVIDAVAASASSDQPIVVATAALIPRLSWDHLDEARWLLVPEEELPELLEAAADEDEIFVVTAGALSDRMDGTGPLDVVGVDVVWGPWQVTQLCGTC